jgi:hypothetical protein
MILQLKHTASSMTNPESPYAEITDPEAAVASLCRGVGGFELPWDMATECRGYRKKGPVVASLCRGVGGFELPWDTATECRGYRKRGAVVASLC